MIENNMPSTESDAEELHSILLAAAPSGHDNFVVRRFAPGNFLVIFRAATDAVISSLPAPSLELTEAVEGVSALEKATFSKLMAFEVQCPLGGEHVVVPSDPVLFELEDFPSKLIQSPVCSPDCGAPPRRRPLPNARPIRPTNVVHAT
jgi:hypothetical protein